MEKNIYELANIAFEKELQKNSQDEFLIQLKEILEKEGRSVNFYIELLTWYIGRIYRIGRLFLEKVFEKIVDSENPEFQKLVQESIYFKEYDQVKKVPIIFKFNKEIQKEFDREILTYLQAVLNRFCFNFFDKKTDMILFFTVHNEKIHQDLRYIGKIFLTAKDIVNFLKS